MAVLERLVIGGVLALSGLVVFSRLSAVVRTLAVVCRGSPTDSPTVTDGTQIAVDGEVFVEESPTATDRLFADVPTAVGAYRWQAGFLGSGTYTYDFDRGEFRQQRKSFASGFESGRFGVDCGRHELYVDLSWLRRRYDSPSLTSLEVGNPRRNISLPRFLTRNIADSPLVHLRSTDGEASVDELTDVVELYREDVQTDEFVVDAKGVPAGQELFVHGQIRVEDGQPTVVGTDETPLLLSDEGPDGLKRALLRRAAAYTLALLAVAGVGGLLL